MECIMQKDPQERHVGTPVPQKIPVGVSKNRDTPKWMVYNGKPYQNGWFGGTTIFGNTQICSPDFFQKPVGWGSRGRLWNLSSDPKLRKRRRFFQEQRKWPHMCQGRSTPYIGDGKIPPLMTGILIMGICKTLLLGWWRSPIIWK